MNKLKNTIEKIGKMAPVKATNTNANSGVRDAYSKYHKSGPELFVTKILMVNGPLTSK
jgi:hypothetical protein